MRFDRVIQALLPHDKKFYALFEQSTGYLIEAAKLLKQFAVSSDAERQGLMKQIQDLEHRGDDVAHAIFAELNSTFVTPFDREDIHSLTSALDDVMDFINGSVTRVMLYKVTGEFPPSIIKLIAILEHSICELDRGVRGLRNLEHTEALHQILKNINKDENDADDEFECAVAELFDKEKDPITIIKMKEIYVALESATDKCEDAANVLETIMIKHA